MKSPKEQLPTTVSEQDKPAKYPSKLETAKREHLVNRMEASDTLEFRYIEDEGKEKLQSLTAEDIPLEVYRTMLATGCASYKAGVLLLNQALGTTRSGPENLYAINGTVGLMREINPQDGLEGMLAAQMTACHNLAMRFSGYAANQNNSTEVVERNLNRVNKLMRTFTTQVEALHKLRSGGKQTVTVQHVNVNQGGQAIVGTVSNGGGVGG